MKRILPLITALLLVWGANASGQERTVQHRPYTDLRPFHFGIHIGAHMQDIEFVNAGPMETVNEDGTVTKTFISCDQDRMDPGFNVGVLGEFRLNERFQFRIAPAIYFGSRHLVFRNHTESTEEAPVTKRQDLKSAYIATAFDLIFAAPRCNNHRAYLMAGVTPTLNLTNKSSDYLRLKDYQTFVEVGLGFDEYLPYFKCRPELKFMFGLGNIINTDHYKELRDETMVSYSRAVWAGHTKMITLTLYFE